jgi:hypothetical protein
VIQCAKKKLNNLPWQDKNDTKIKKYVSSWLIFLACIRQFVAGMHAWRRNMYVYLFGQTVRICKQSVIRYVVLVSDGWKSEIVLDIYTGCIRKKYIYSWKKFTNKSQMRAKFGLMSNTGDSSQMEKSKFRLFK